MHPILVHLPLGALPAGAVLVILALLFKSQGKGLVLGALVTMVLGTAGVMLAAASGEAGADAVGKGVAGALIEEHEELGEAARNFFIALTGVFAVLAGAYWIAGARASRAVVTGGGVVFLIAYGAGLLVLANAGHAGGVLVHQNGIHAPMGPAVPSGAAHHDDD